MGPEFEGLRLTHFIWTDEDHSELEPGKPYPLDRAVTLGYGACDFSDDQLDSGEARCPVPITVIIDAPGAFPPADEVEDSVFGPPYAVRGAIARDTATATTVWLENGLVISVHANEDLRRAAVLALSLANAEALGLPALQPGDDWGPLANWAAPEN